MVSNQKYLIVGFSLLSVYVMAPTISRLFNFRSDGKSNESKRPDKYTTGLVNSSNDCFANASVQALASLPRFTVYLNDILSLLASVQLQLPLHTALAQLLAQLQTVVTYSQQGSVTNMLQVLETYYKSTIPRGQHDAQELTQFILEMLQNEHASLQKMVKDVPIFPFQGEISTSLTCLRCQGTSNVTANQFLMYPIHLPQTNSVKLSEMLFNNQTDVINDYSCLKCRIIQILNNNSHLNDNKYFQTLAQDKDAILINEELPSDLQSFINEFPTVKSTVVKKTVMTSAPQDMIIFLSRSIFSGSSYTRNPCNVSFEEQIEIPIQKIVNNTCQQITNTQYELRSIVQHSGSHHSGHYQCYRHKPELYKDLTSKEIIIRTPTINIQTNAQTLSPQSKDSHKNLFDEASQNKTPTSTEGLLETDMDAATFTANLPSRKPKKLKTIQKYPFWLLSDSRIREASTDEVLNCTKYVYMLYFDRTNSER